MAKLHDIRRHARLLRRESRSELEVVDTIWFGPDLLFVTTVDDSGTRTEQFLDQKLAAPLQLDSPEVPEPRYPTQVPRLFRTVEEIVPLLTLARRQHRFHPMMQAYVREVASRLSNSLATVEEIYAVAGARNDALSTSPSASILWEVFGTPARIEEDLRKLERDKTPRRIRVAVVLDPEVDNDLFETFQRAYQGSSVEYWVRASDLMLATRLPQTVLALDKQLESALSNDWPDQLRLTEFSLHRDSKQWSAIPSVPYGFSGLSKYQSGTALEDPVFVLDIENIGSREAKIAAAFICVRLRQIKAHGFAGDERLTPSCSIALPLNDGEEGYREVYVDPPLLVAPGRHARILVRLDDAGYGWRGEVELGLRYGPTKILRVPALTLLR